jgi:hypothetical protein
MNKAIAYHSDLDGIFSGIILNRRLGPATPIQLDYSKDVSGFYDKFDEFTIVDFGQNPFGDKTKLWIDHHHINEEEDVSKLTHDDSPSCVRTLQRLKYLQDVELSEEELDAIDVVDTASYDLTKLEPSVIVFPSKDNVIERMMTFNQLLRRNRNTFITKDIFEADTLNVVEALDIIEKSNNPRVIKYFQFLKKKKHLFEKINKEKQNLVLEIGIVPMLNTENFSPSDWRGWDINLFGLLEQNRPFVSVLYKINNNINLQVYKNIYYRDSIKRSLYEILEDLDVEKEGHDNILNFHFKNGKEAFEVATKVFGEISEALA